MMLRYECMNDSTHAFKGRNNLDGVTCPICEGGILPQPFDEQVHNDLPDYRKLKKEYGEKMKNKTVTIKLNEKQKQSFKDSLLKSIETKLDEYLDGTDVNLNYNVAYDRDLLEKRNVNK